MKIIRLQTQGFKRVVAVDITPKDALVRVGGDNGEGKTSLLDSIMAALGGATAAPIKPVRTGDDFAAIRVELGDGKADVVVTKYFDEVGEKLRVESADGAEYKAGQTKVADLLGRMTFDPLAFARMKADEQAAELRRLVPLKVDLDALAKADAADVIARRDVNREGKQIVARRDAIEVSGIVPERPDREAIVAALGSAGAVNAAIDDERYQRDRIERVAVTYDENADKLDARAIAARKEAERLEAEAGAVRGEAEAMRKELASRPALDEPVDTAKLSTDLAQADKDLALLNRIDERKRLDAEVSALRTRSDAFTTAIADRAAQRAQALAEAPIPVPGLALARLCDVVPGEESPDLIVTYEGEPFVQASGAQQLRVSMRLAMSANPKLRVMLIREGSLLDEKSLAVVRELAAEGDYQVWLETVGEGDGSGLIMEAGAVRGAPEPERLEGPKRRKTKEGDVVVEGEKVGEVVEVKVENNVAGPVLGPKPPARRKPSDMRKPSDLFGGGE